MAVDDKIIRGQAYNLACADVTDISTPEAVKEMYKDFVMYMEVIQALVKDRDSTDIRISKGQAVNLAAKQLEKPTKETMIALAERYFQLGQLVKSANLEDIRKAAGDE